MNTRMLLLLVVAWQVHEAAPKPADLAKPHASWTERITKDGAYVAKFYDPNNEFRCHMGGVVDRDNGTEGITIVCAKVHEVQKESK